MTPKKIPKEQMRLDTGITDKQMEKPLEKVFDRVVMLAGNHPAVKGNYNLLVSYYLRDYHGLKMAEIKKLLSLPSPETITRAFRKAVELGRIEPTEKMRKRRAQREQVISDYSHVWGEDDSKRELNP